MPRHRRGAAPDAESEQSEKRPAAKRGGRLLKVALLGSAVGLLVRDDVRARVLDLLFGAEEEFDYSSVTEPVVPGSEAVAAAAAADTVVAPASSTPVEDEDAAPSDPPPADDQKASARTVAPSPAAWGHVPDEPTAQTLSDKPASKKPATKKPAGKKPASEEPDADADTGDAAAGDPPVPPSDWWTPGEGAGSASDG
jgi:hypothetical protein